MRTGICVRALRVLLVLSAAGALFVATGCRKDNTSSTDNKSDQDTKQNLPAADDQPTEVSAGAGSPERAGLRFVVVTHGQASDPFWSVVKNGVDQAAKDMGVKVEYQAPSSFDMVAMGQLIDAAVASKPDGLVVSIPDSDALEQPIKRAVDAGIAVISINSGSEVAKSFGLMTHVGQTEYEAGVGAGERMANIGIKRALCVNHEVGNTAQDLRCKGFADALKTANVATEVLAVDLADPTETQQRVTAKLASDSAIDGILTLGPNGADPVLAALEAQGATDRIHLATFDLTPAVLAAIRDGKMLFAIDQQQYVQGYMPIVLLTLYKTNLNTPAVEVLRTGPGFVTKDTAERVIALSKQGTR